MHTNLDEDYIAVIYNKYFLDMGLILTLSLFSFL